jgi:molecular chaperone DnaK (HSP70)
MTTVAIDFGTSNTVVALLSLETKAPKTLEIEPFSRFIPVRTAAGGLGNVPVIPTLVFVKEGGELVIGEPVRSQLGGRLQERLFQAFKHDLAADFQSPPCQLDGSSYTAELVAERFFKLIWQQLSQQQIHPIRVIFTVPTGAFARYANWFRGLASQLDISEVQLVDECTAVALGYGVQRSGTVVLVVDFGGGSLDLSLVCTAASEGKQVLRSQVLAKSDASVGGIDIDIWIAEYYLQQIGSSRTQLPEISWQNLLAAAEQLKIRLSSEVEAKESWFDAENIARELQLSRQELEEILASGKLLEQLKQSLDEVLAIALTKSISQADIEQVLLVGGSCLIPAVQQLVISYFGKQRVKSERPLEVLAHGALALSQLAGDNNCLQHSYAIRLWEPHTKTSEYLTLFEKGMPYPCQCSEPLVLQVAIDGQREIYLDIGEVTEVSQAEAEVTYDAQGRMTSSELHKQAEYQFREIHQQPICVAHLEPPSETEVDRIEMMFEVNEERMLLVTVRDLQTKQVLLEKGAIAILN